MKVSMEVTCEGAPFSLFQHTICFLSSMPKAEQLWFNTLCLCQWEKQTRLCLFSVLLSNRIIFTKKGKWMKTFYCIFLSVYLHLPHLTFNLRNSTHPLWLCCQQVCVCVCVKMISDTTAGVHSMLRSSDIAPETPVLNWMSGIARMTEKYYEWV